MAKTKPETKAPALPGVAPKVPRHKVLYILREPTAGYQPVGSYELGDAEAEAQGRYLFEAIRSEHINRARAASAQLPQFLEQTEENGLKVEG